jgi:hypothetical protein
MKAYEKFLLLSFKRIFGIQSEVTPEMANVVPTVVINDDLYNSEKTQVIKSATQTGSGTTVIYTTPTDRDFYLTGCLLSVHKATTENGTEFELAGVVNGQTVYFNAIQAVSTLVRAETSYLQFAYPIKLDKNTPIGLVVGSSTVRAMIFGFEQPTRL